jgi:hypothetical protein
MRRGGVSSEKCSNGSLRDSLITIKETQAQLHLQNGICTTAAMLASKIELCDILLAEISSVHASLAKGLKGTRSRPKVSRHADLNA